MVGMCNQISTEGNVQGSTHSNIRSTGWVNTPNSIQTVTFTEILQETFNLIFKLMRNSNVWCQYCQWWN